MTDREAGYYWVKDRGNPHLVIYEWSPECGQRGMWFAPGIDGGFDPDWIRVCSGKISKPSADGMSEPLECLSAFVTETVDYMTRNKLGDPEMQHNVKWARSIIAKREVQNV